MNQEKSKNPSSENHFNGVLQTNFLLCEVFQLSRKTPDKPGKNALKLKMISLNVVMILNKILVNISKSCDNNAHYTTPNTNMEKPVCLS